MLKRLKMSDKVEQNKQIEQTDQLKQIGVQILSTTQNELYLSMRYLDVALGSMPFVMDPGISGLGTDGLAIYFDPRYLGGLFREDPQMVDRIYLHMVLHGVFRHMTRRKGRDPRYYNLACEIAVESVIDGLNVRCVRRSRSWLRRETYRRLENEMKVLTAERIYDSLLDWKLSEQELAALEADFCTDDHSRWPKDDDKKTQMAIENQWKDVSDEMETNLETFSKDAADAAGHFVDQLKVENRACMDYRNFLRKFSVLREEQEVDQDSFDYVFYTYGLSLYGNMPLIEPQETKEALRIEDFVIVIDTSMSVAGDLVKKFLKETYGVLSENNSYFRQVNIHLIQCDEQVHTDVKITCQEDLKDYMDRLQLFGEGGTDFRPAFAYVEELIEKKELTSLKGLLYFTDGKGIYPAKMPPYDVAFVFMEEEYEDVNVPPWAMKLILRKEDLEDDPVRNPRGSLEGNP